MNQIKKHSFEAVSLLTAANGMLEATIIPALNQPDWIVPSTLILESLDYSDEDDDRNSHRDGDNEPKSTVRTRYYTWQQQPVAVFSLLPKDQVPDTVVILEGNAIAQRLALQTKGQLRQIKVSISDVQDSELPLEYSVATESVENDTDSTEELVDEDIIASYLFQAIVIEETIYIVPDLDKIAHQLTIMNQDQSTENSDATPIVQN